MNIEQEFTPVTSFKYGDKELPVSFVETMQVTEGVECDVYTFDGDNTKDLGIIRIKPGSKTPLQRVLKGDRTVEGYISGRGKLTITKSDGKHEVHVVNEKLEKPVEISVAVGELMQWQADHDNELKAYEVCYPPYEGGRYENIE